MQAITTKTLYYEPSSEDNYQSVDLYFSSSSSSSSPLIAFIHGGAWRTEDKADYKNLCMGFVELGYTVASINYRLSLKKDNEEVPSIQHPSHIMDVGKSIEYLYNLNSQDKKYDSHQIYLVGHSAGAHIALMLLLSDQLPYHKYIQGVIGVSGIYDIPLLLKKFPSYIDFIEQAFGADKTIYFEASPTSKISNQLNKKPIIIAQSHEDTLINSEQAEVMANHLKTFHSNVTLDMTLKGDHYDIMNTKNLSKLVESLFQ